MQLVAPILTYVTPPTFGGVTYVWIVDIDHMLALEVDICQYLQFGAHFVRPVPQSSTGVSTLFLTVVVSSDMSSFGPVFVGK